MSDDEKVTQLPVRKKRPEIDEDCTLKVVRDWSCQHRWFAVDDAKEEVECGECGERLNPIWVLRQMASEETQLAQTRARLIEKVKELRGRTRYKCGACGQMNNLTETLKFRAR